MGGGRVVRKPTSPPPPPPPPRTENFYDEDICRYDDARTAVDTADQRCDDYVQPESPFDDDIEDQYLQPVVDDALDDDDDYTDATHPQRVVGIDSYIELLDDYRDYSK